MNLPSNIIEQVQFALKEDIGSGDVTADVKINWAHKAIEGSVKFTQPTRFKPQSWSVSKSYTDQ